MLLLSSQGLLILLLNMKGAYIKIKTEWKNLICVMNFSFFFFFSIFFSQLFMAFHGLWEL